MRRRRDMWDEMRKMQEYMDALYEDFFGFGKSRKLLPGTGGRELDISDYRHPLTDLWESENEVVATLEIPGVDKKDIDITITDDRIEVKVEKKTKKEDEKKGVYRLERSYSGFYRAMQLPTDVNPSRAEATYKNGVLEIRVPKEKDTSKKKKIEVK